MALASALKQHPPFERAGPQKRKTDQDLFAYRRQVRSHQSNRLHEARVQSRLAPGFLQEHAAVERLMLGTNNGQSVVSTEMNAGHRTQPNRHIWKLREISRLLGVRHDTNRNNEDLPLVQLGVKKKAKKIKRRRK